MLLLRSQELLLELKPALNINSATPKNTHPSGSSSVSCSVLHHTMSQPFRAALKGAPMTHSLTREQGDLNLTPRPCAGGTACFCCGFVTLAVWCLFSAQGDPPEKAFSKLGFFFLY